MVSDDDLDAVMWPRIIAATMRLVILFVLRRCRGLRDTCGSNMNAILRLGKVGLFKKW
jgi:hypothetical protein